MCDRTVPAKFQCGDCSANKSANCQSTFGWLWNCDNIGTIGNEPASKKACEHCNRELVLAHILDLLALVIPFGATYGEWLGGVSDPDLNALIKAFTGTFLIDAVLNIYNNDLHKTDPKYTKHDVMKYALLDSLSVGGWVLMSQIVQDYVFHGAPNRVIAAGIAGLANYYHTVGKPPVTMDSQQIGGLVVFASAMASFAGNWSMMGDNLLSRFMSCTTAGFFSFFSAINGTAYINCIMTNKLFPKEAVLSALQLGIASSLAGTLAESAIGKPVVSGLAAGFTALYTANSIFNNKSTFGKCG